ncbi:hypothetical protein ACLI4U_14395 [Natrialbaceae archaeon A-CW2]
MDRRRLLAASAAGFGAVAGCLETATTSSEPTANTRIVGIEPDEQPDLSVAPSVAIQTSEETETAPASIAVEWKHVGDEELSLGESRFVRFTNVRAENGNAHLIRPDYFGNLDETATYDGCWRVTDGLAMDGSFDTTRLEVDDIHSGEPRLYAADGDCLSSDSYRFETNLQIEYPADGTRIEGEWGFELEVETDEG